MVYKNLFYFKKYLAAFVVIGSLFFVGKESFGANPACYFMPMRVDSHDPGKICFGYPNSQVVKGSIVGVYLYAYSATAISLIESFPAQVIHVGAVGNPSDPLWTSFRFEGRGRFFSVNVDQRISPLPGIIDSTITNLNDGHVQSILHPWER